jgi:hypothetical protein
VSLETCWTCAYREEPGFEMFACKKKMVSVDGRSLIGKILGVKPWKNYTMDAIFVKDHKCQEYVNDNARLM